MPTYPYRCPQCGKFDFSQRITEKPLQQCPTCGSPVERLIGKNVNIVYKCGGFYSTDTASSAKPVKSDNTTSDSSATIKTDSAVPSDNKPATETKSESEKNNKASA